MTYFVFLQDGCEEISQGECQDIAKVFYHRSDLENDENGIIIQNTSYLISNTDFLAIRLTTCIRRITPIRDQAFGILAKAVFVGECAHKKVLVI